ncbi:hypothetical protein [Microcoleus sp. FACHB-672]|uniref:hypothetical protein n=1 Tax=Microcoleus sp. FACHB-672 TaxID=2692825 RepID=UPI00168516C5|nr:hypothetical protein [Microcoleus sp. FACHB-672]MBD2040728.1 hypothetical protein [Microcoleus sp. FACHB-672]
MFKNLKKIVSTLLIVITITVNMSLAFPRSVSASPFPNLSEVEQQVKGSLPNIDWQQVKLSVPNSLPNIDWEQVKGSVPNIDWEQVKGSVASIDWEQIKGSVPNINWDQIKESVFKINFQELQQAFSGNVQQVISKVDIQQLREGLTDSALSQKVGGVIAGTSSTVVNQAQKYLDTTPDQLCSIYRDHLQGIDNSQWDALQTGAASTFTVLQAVNSASAAGAGALSSYAGIASAVSQLGLGGVTATAAGLLGSSATGAAATAVVTSFVGGPLVMGALLAGGTGLAAWGSYKTIEFTAQQFDGLTKEFCTQQTP